MPQLIERDALEDRGKALRILAKTLYRDLKQNGYTPRQVVALTTELISLVTSDLREEEPRE